MGIIDIKEYPYWLTLESMSGITTREKNNLVVKVCYEQNQPISELFKADKSTLEGFGIDKEKVQIILEARENLANNSFLAEDMLEQGYDLIPIFDSRYSKTLKSNLGYNAPVVLYVKGNQNLLNNESIAVVGSRNSSAISLDFTKKVSSIYAKQGKTIVSGYAAGVDRAAFDAALESGGSTIVVLPQGIMTFSSGFKSMYKHIVDGKVLVVSQFHPKSPWNVGLAMARNSTIYALAEEIYVAQSDSKGGTWAGVIEGLKKSRRIFVREPGSREKNANSLLIEKGAIGVHIEGDSIVKVPKIEEKEEEVTLFSECNVESDAILAEPREKYNGEGILFSELNFDEDKQ